jgi:hypothetical protein
MSRLLPYLNASAIETRPSVLSTVGLPDLRRELLDFSACYKAG